MQLKFLLSSRLFQELQQLTFSSCKNHSTYKGLIGISPSGAVAFVSDLYLGSISDISIQLTRQYGILDLLVNGDLVMADRSFGSTYRSLGSKIEHTPLS